jgi:hypothetical protein
MRIGVDMNEEKRIVSQDSNPSSPAFAVFSVFMPRQMTRTANVIRLTEPRNLDRGIWIAKERKRRTHATPFSALNSPTPNVVTSTPKPCLILAYPSTAYAPPSSFAMGIWLAADDRRRDGGKRKRDEGMEGRGAYHLQPIRALGHSRCSLGTVRCRRVSDTSSEAN